MKKTGKKLWIWIGFCIMACTLAGCGNNGTKEHIKTGEERAIEAKKDASEVVDQVNENAKQLEQEAGSIEDEE